MRTYDHVLGAFERVGLRPKPSKCEQTHKNKEVDILGIAFDKKESLEPSREKLESLFSETAKALHNCFWNVGNLRELLGCWNWLVLLTRPAISVLQICYELAGSGKEYVKATNEARMEF